MDLGSNLNFGHNLALSAAGAILGAGGKMTRILALDLETTGLRNSDRIVEIGAVLFDTDENRIIAEFESLINPQRNIPAESSQIHGLTSADVSLAPVFEDIAEDFKLFMDADVIVAHNAAFDIRFLKNEFIRYGTEVEFRAVDCTFALTGAALPVACERISYPLDHHSALSDAKASLAVWLFENHNSYDHGQLATPSLALPGYSRTLTRSQIGKQPVDLRPSGLSYLSVDFSQVGAEKTYVGLLDAYLRDFHINSIEGLGLADFASDTGITPTRQLELRDSYLASVRHAAMRDGVITAEEAEIYCIIARALGSDSEIEPTRSANELPAQGALVCVTGTVSIQGVLWDKRAIRELIESLGLQFTDELNKKSGVALLLQDSEGSLSSKIRKAQAWGIPRMVIADFVGLAAGA